MPRRKIVYSSISLSTVADPDFNCQFICVYCVVVCHATQALFRLMGGT